MPSKPDNRGFTLCFTVHTHSQITFQVSKQKTGGFQQALVQNRTQLQHSADQVQLGVSVINIQQPHSIIHNP